MKVPISNETPYRAREVRAVIEDALGRKLLNSTVDDTGEPLAKDWLTIRVVLVPYEGKGGRGLYGEAKWPGSMTKRRRWPIYVRVGRIKDYPIEVSSHGGLYITLNSWQEDAYHTASHEAWHVMHGPGEQEANAYSDRKLRLARIRGFFGLRSW